MMKKITILFFIAVVITLFGFNLTACSRALQSSAKASAAATGKAPEASGKPGLYAKALPITEQDIPITDVAANDISAAFAFVNANPGPAGNPIQYTLLIDQNINSGFQFLGADRRRGEFTAALTIAGIGGEQIIQYNGSAEGSLFHVGDWHPGGSFNGNLTLENNITLRGINDGRNALVRVVAGTLTMKAGSKITGHTNRGGVDGGGAVTVSDTFIMDGGEISGNNFPFSLFSERAADHAAEHVAGGVFVSTPEFGSSLASFIMNGGTITNNKSFFAGGVFVGNHSVFLMNGGSITGNFNEINMLNPQDVHVTIFADYNQTGGNTGEIYIMDKINQYYWQKLNGFSWDKDGFYINFSEVSGQYRFTFTFQNMVLGFEDEIFAITGYKVFLAGGTTFDFNMIPNFDQHYNQHYDQLFINNWSGIQTNMNGRWDKVF